MSDWGRGRRRSVLAVVACAVGLIVVRGIATGASLGGSGTTSQPTVHVTRVVAHAIGTEPPFLLASNRGQGAVVTLRSPKTGQIVVNFPRIRTEFTNNGLSATPKGSAAFVTTIPTGRGDNLNVTRLDAKTHRLRVVARGENPVVSPNGRYLAYTTGPTTDVIAVRDLQTGATRSVSLQSLVGGRSAFNGTVTWDRGSSMLLVTVPAIAAATAGAHTAATAPAASCGSDTHDPVCTISVVLTSAHGLKASRVSSTGVRRLNELDGLGLPGVDSRDPQSFIVCAPTGRQATAVYRLTLDGRTAYLKRLFTTSQFLLAVSPDEQWALYLKPKTQSIWRARVVAGHLGRGHAVMTDARPGAIQW